MSNEVQEGPKECQDICRNNMCPKAAIVIEQAAKIQELEALLNFVGNKLDAFTTQIEANNVKLRNTTALLEQRERHNNSHDPM